MEFINTFLITIHLLSSIFWASGALFMCFVIYPVWKKYDDYLYFANYKLELMQKYIKALNIALVLSFITGLSLVFWLKNLTVEKYTFFSVKMVLLLLSFFLVYPYLAEKNADEKSEKPELIRKEMNMPVNIRSLLLLVCVLSLVYISVFLRKYY